MPRATALRSICASVALALLLGACGAIDDIDVGLGGGGDPTTPSTRPRPTTSTTDRPDGPDGPDGPDEPEDPERPEDCEEPPIWAYTVVTSVEPEDDAPDPGDPDDRGNPDDPGGTTDGCEPTPEPGPTPEPELGTGDVQITLRWSSSADIDLHVFEPDGTEIWFSDPGPTATGGQLDVDSNVGCEQEASVENVYWPEGQMPLGGYRVVVTGFQVDDCGSGDYTVTAAVRGQPVLEQVGTVATDEEDEYTFEAR